MATNRDSPPEGLLDYLDGLERLMPPHWLASGENYRRAVYAYYGWGPPPDAGVPEPVPAGSVAFAEHDFGDES
jgi:hypothetical protein